MKGMKLATLAVLCASAQAHAYDLMALWESRDLASTDTFYTTYYNDYRGTTLSTSQGGYGWEIHGVAAWVPCSLDTLNGPNGEVSYRGSTAFPDTPPPPGDTRWTHGYGARMDFACAQPSGALPLYRLYKGAPQTDHVYTTSVTEFNSLKAAGYGFDRVEGYLFATQVSGSSPLYRLSKGANLVNQDVEHRYTLSSSARQSLLTAGWTDEGIIGYAFSSYVNPTVVANGYTGTFNGYNISPNSTTAVPIRNLVAPTQTLTVGGDFGAGNTSQYGTLASNVTTRPAGAVWQNMSFSFYTGSLFPANPTSSPLNHLPMYLHYASQASKNGLSILQPYDGIAMVLAPGNTFQSDNNVANCGAPGAGGQIFFEIGMSNAASCAPNLSTPLLPNTWYNFSYSLSDNADVRITVTNQSTGQPLSFLAGGTVFAQSLASYFSCPMTPGFGTLAANKTQCLNPYTPEHFPTGNTGYLVFPLMKSLDITARISGMQVRWLNASLVPIP